MAVVKALLLHSLATLMILALLETSFSKKTCLVVRMLGRVAAKEALGGHRPLPVAGRDTGDNTMRGSVVVVLCSCFLV